MYQITLCTCPNQKTAQQISECLVKNKSAACVNIIPGITSIYEWQGKIESTQEHLLIIKSSDAKYNSIESTIRSLHPYELPEIITVPIERGLTDYLQWIDTCLS